ncbi:MAG: hypothetical protein AB9M53_10550 [Leptothrix sp. (in: b-proteobacteria)]
MDAKNKIWLSAAGFIGLPCTAQAHIKWFHDYDLMVPPKGLPEVLASAYFAPVLLAAWLVLLGATLVDARLVQGNGLLVRGFAGIEAWCQDRTYLFLRLASAVLFCVLGMDGRTILTPELAASSPCVGELQTLAGLCALFPATGAISGVIILLLYGMGIEKYGMFHMLDYPAFIGIAIYLIWMAVDRQAGRKALMVVRVATALTLMVGATEKFGYPNWSHDMLRQNPVLTFGITDLDFYMIGAGVVEFALAYLTLFGRIAAKAGAGLLFVLMASAIVLFGWTDAVGHALFLAALLALSLNHNPLPERIYRSGPGTLLRNAVISSSLFVVMVLGFVQLYQAANLRLTTCVILPGQVHLHK